MLSKMKTPPSSTLRGAAFAAFFTRALFAADFDEMANTRTPLGLTSQQINNTTKALTAPKPPMGWNSWDNFGLDITEAEFKGQVDYVASHLKQYGYAYMVIDAGWYAPNLSAVNGDPYNSGTLTRYPTNVDAYGRWIPAANRFPSAADGSFKSLAAYVHGKGLKFGLHIQRGIPWTAIERNTPIKGTPYHAQDIANPADACLWWDATLGVDMSKKGAQEYYDSCYELFASWGVDFVKVDDMSRPYHADEITAVRMALEKTGRSIVFSLSPGSTPIQARYHVQNNSDMWRISDDFWDTWPQLKSQFALAQTWMRFRKEGHWPDLDMLPVGMVGARSNNSGAGRRCRFNEDELRTMMTMWCMFRSPLILGGDLTALSDFETGLITNGELLDIDQNSSGCRQASSDAGSIVYFAEQPAKHRKYVALFNVSDGSRQVKCSFGQMGIPGSYGVREIWSGRDLGTCSGEISAEVAAHGVALFELTAP
jgi:alpha-galactosidase